MASNKVFDSFFKGIPKSGLTPDFKTVANESTKQPRAKRKSDEIYNARRRAKRALEKAKQRANAATEAGQRYISSLQTAINASYAETKGAKRGQYKFAPTQLEKTLTTIASVATQPEQKQRAKRKNEIFKRDLRLSAKEAEGAKYSKAEVKLFYTATRGFWEGKPPKERNRAILEGLGVKTLEEAWQIVFENEDAQEALKRAQQAQLEATSDEDISDGQAEPPDEEGSPDYIKYYINVTSKQ